MKVQRKHSYVIAVRVLNILDKWSHWALALAALGLRD
jgi:hypothetical protein